jgi:hypothetical protein
MYVINFLNFKENIANKNSLKYLIKIITRIKVKLFKIAVFLMYFKTTQFK